MACCGNKRPTVKYEDTHEVVRLPPPPVKPMPRQAEVLAEAADDESDTANDFPVFQDDGLQSSDYADMCRKLLSMVSAMRDAGAQAVLNLPQVVVAGNQSAGKSSVIEALCGITLPRSDGTCTRCPMEVVMRDVPGGNATWVAAVRIRREWDAAGNRLPAPESTIVKAGIREPRDVEGAVRAAQDMVLAVDAPPGGGVNERAAFSRNTIVVEVSGAPVSLALVDLPGIIHATEANSRTVGPDHPALITSLIREYASRPSSVIVAVVSCKEDLDTQGILSLARELDPDGARTLGVLTKPDMIEEACHGLWMAVMQGKRWPLKLGYYAVKNPAQAQLNAGLPHHAARQHEANFFATGPWSVSLNPAYVASRLGTPRLRAALARLLADLTAAAMPALLADAQHQLTSVEAALAVLPPPVVPPARLLAGKPGLDTEALLRRTMATLVEDVCSGVACLMAPHGNTPLPAWQTQALMTGGASSTPSSIHTGTNALQTKPSVSGLAGITPVRPFWTGLMSVFQDFRSSIFSARPAYVVNGVCFSCASGDDENVGAQGGADAAASQSQPHSTMTLEEVFSLMESHRGLELPGFSPYGAVQSLVSRSTSGWSLAADQVVHAATQRVTDAVMMVLHDRLARFPAALRAARGAAHALLSEMNVAAAEQVRILITMECAAAFTMNRAEFEGHSSATLRQLREAVATSPLPEINTVPEVRGASRPPRGHSLGSLGHVTSGSQYDPSAGPAMMNGTGPYSDHVLSMVAVSLTYFTLAARRVVDYVPMTILHNLVNRCGAELKTVLAADLLAGQGGAASLSHLLVEDESLCLQRADLQQQRSTLTAALSVMRAMGPKW